MQIYISYYIPIIYASMSGPSLVGGTMALCQRPCAAAAADCCKRRSHAPCM